MCFDRYLSVCLHIPSSMFCVLCASTHTHTHLCFLCLQVQAMEKRSLRLCVTFLEQIAKQTSTVVLEICAEQRNLCDQVKSQSISGFKKLII